MNVDTAKVQQQAIKLLKEGQSLFTDGKTLEDRKKGYNSYVDGIELLNKLRTYMRDNRSAHEVLTRTIKDYMENAKKK